MDIKLKGVVVILVLITSIYYTLPTYKAYQPGVDPQSVENKVNLGLGFNFINNNNYFKNNRLAMELLIPLYRDYKGIQMADSFSLMLGWQY